MQLRADRKFSNVLAERNRGGEDRMKRVLGIFAVLVIVAAVSVVAAIPGGAT
jgi:hypothetical protein